MIFGYRPIILAAIPMILFTGSSAAAEPGSLIAAPIAAPVPADLPQNLSRAQAETIAAAEGKKAKSPAQALAYAPASSSGRTDIDVLIDKYAMLHGLPSSLIHSVVKRESTYNPKARNGRYWGLMQISYPTARAMGYKGDPSGLLDAETNLKYAVKYLAGAYLVADGNERRASKLYQTGYYYQAKRKGLLEETGLR